MKIRQITESTVQEGMLGNLFGKKDDQDQPKGPDLVIYVKHADGSKTYANVKDAQHLADLQKKYRDQNPQVLDSSRQDVLDWLQSRGVSLSKFWPGAEITVGNRSLAEFAPSGDDGDDGFSDETLKRLAAEWYRGDEDPKVERTLAAAGWEIGQDEGYDDEPGVFVVQAGDVNGRSYMSWSAHELQSLNEFAPAGGGGNRMGGGGRRTGGDGDDDSGEDPYKYPQPEHYSRSIDFFGRFEADHFDDEVFDKATGEFRGYWDDQEGRDQIAYFKFDNPRRTGDDDPGMGWYYEPQNESVAEGHAPRGEYSRVLSALGLYYPDKFSMEELNTPDWHRVIANKADVPVEYAGKVIDDFTRPVDGYDDEWPEDDEQGMAEGIKGEIAGGAVGSLVGGAAGAPLGMLGNVVGSAVGGSVGSAIGSRWEDGKPLKEKQQLDEMIPLLAAGARLFMAVAPKIAQVVGRAGQAGARGAGQATRAGAEIAAKNAGQIGMGVGAYEIGSSVADIAKDITAKVGTAVDEKTVFELATLAFKYAIPAGIVLAILYGGKKAIDAIFDKAEDRKAMAENQGEDYGPELAALKKEFGKFDRHYTRMEKDPAYAARYNKQQTDQQNRQVPNDDDEYYGDDGDMLSDKPYDPLGEAKPKEKEADYGPDYQDMVARVKKLAGLGPLKTVYDPQKRVYKNVPVAVQPKK